MSSRKALSVWVLIVLAFLAIIGALHGWILWQTGSASMITIFSYTIEVRTYFLGALLTAFAFIGGACFVVFHSESLELPLYQLSKDFEEKLNIKSEEIKNSTDDSLAKLGLREFQLKETMQIMQQKLGELENKLKESVESQEKNLATAQKKLTDMERKIDTIQVAQRELPALKKKLQPIEVFEKDLKNIQGMVEKISTVPQPYLASTNEINILEGKLLKPETVRQLKENGIGKIEDLLLKSPVEVALTNTMSESEAKNLQSVVEMLMIPGVQHDDAVLLLKSGVNSKQELALQDALSLGARVSKTAELYIREGKIKENERPTLEEIASWIKSARMQ